jgi:hypothetical protein
MSKHNLFNGQQYTVFIKEMKIQLLISQQVLCVFANNLGHRQRQQENKSNEKGATPDSERYMPTKGYSAVKTSV